VGTILFTGFPGFLGVQLLPRVMARSPEAEAVCVVQPKFAGVATRRLEELVAQDPSLAGRVQLVAGDITSAGLGLDDPRRLAARLQEVWHLAAVYDLSVARDVGMAVNVVGTHHVLDLAESAPSLERVQYVSTCYVSGRWAGAFGEDDLDVGQRFNNFYEETKFLAEVEVQRRRDSGLPTTVYRPAVVVGDSTTGATQKYDGPYYALQLMLRQGRWALMPALGDPTLHRFNIVPRDFVVDAIAVLSHMERSIGRVYQLADPAPLTVADLYRVMAEAVGCRLLPVPLPASLARFAIEHVPGVRQLLRIPSTTIAYLTHPTYYLTANQADLDGSGVACPPLRSYMGRLVDFMRRHPEISPEAMQ
jgi:thioester reductase-like protein